MADDLEPKPIPAHRSKLGNFTIAGNFKCERCMHSEATVDAFNGVVCQFCGHGAYVYGAQPRWMGRALFHFRNGRSEIRSVDFGRPRTWKLFERQDVDDPVNLHATIHVFERRDWIAAYGFIGPTRDSEYYEI